jgi:hypothetical protein
MLHKEGTVADGVNPFFELPPIAPESEIEPPEVLAIVEIERFSTQLNTDPTDGCLLTIAKTAEEIHFVITEDFKSGSGTYVTQLVDLIVDFARQSFKRIPGHALLRMKSMLQFSGVR